MTSNAYDLIVEFDCPELVALARLDMNKGQLDQALAKIKRATRMEPHNSEALLLNAKLYAQLRLFDKAKQCYSQFLELNPEVHTEKFEYGMVHFENKEVDRALTLWNEVLSVMPQHPPALFYKGLAMAQKGQLDSARQTLEMLLRAVAADNLYFERAKELLAKIGQANEYPNEPNNEFPMFNSGNKVIN